MLTAALTRGLAVLTAATVLAGLPVLPASAGGGSISGRVTDSGGAAVGGACVSVYPFDVPYGTPPPKASTAADGTYRVPDVLPGRSLVLIQPCAAVADLAPQWWRGRTSEQDALAVQVADGQDTGGVDAVLVAGATISGRVTDEQGAPVEGACVSTVVEQHDRGGSSHATARTDSDGRYRLARLPAVTYRVTAARCAEGGPDVFAPGTSDRLAARTITLTTGAVVTDANVVLPTPTGVSGTVAGADGAPLGDACIEVREPGFGGRFIASTTTGTDGTWRTGLVGGTYVLRVSSCRDGRHLTRWFDGSRWAAEPATLTVRAGEPVAAPPLTMAAAGIVRGSVVDDTGAPITRPCVWAYPEGTGARSGLQPYPHLVRVEHDGAYLVGGLPTGRYFIGVGACADGTYGMSWVGGDDREGTAVAVEVATGRVTVADAVRPRAAYVSGTLRDPAGLPARGCARFNVSYVASSDSDGRYLSPPLYPRQHRVGFGASCTQLAHDTDPSETHQTVSLTPGATTDGVDAVITQTTLFLSGQVRDPSGDGIPTACIEASSPGRRTELAYSDKTGAWRIDGLEPGSWTLLFRACLTERNLLPTWYPGVPALSESVPVALGATAMTGLDLVMREGARVVGTITRPDGTPVSGVCVRAYEPGTGADRRGVGGRTGSDGSFDLRALSPGAHQLLADVCFTGNDTPADTSAATYFPGTTTRRADAQPVLLAVGDNPGKDWQLLAGGSVRGRLVDRDGGPVRGCVEMQGENWTRQVTSGTDGVFVVPGLGTADRPSYTVHGCGGERATLRPRWGPTTQGVARDVGPVFLPVAGSISGQLRHEDTGAPLDNGCISVLNDEGEYTHGAATDDNGRYTVRHLPPGSYRLELSGCRLGELVVPEWYDDALLQSDARRITVSENQHVSGIDASLRAVRLPGIPRDVLTYVSGSASTLTWREPADDGGAWVRSYVVRDSVTGNVLATADGGSRSLVVPTVAAVTLEAVNVKGAGPRATARPGTGPEPAPVGEPPGVTPGLQPLAPARVLDTRTGNGVAGRLPAGRAVRLPILGRGGVPTARVSAVLVNATATGASAPGHLTVFPGGAPPVASTLNYGVGGAVAGLALVPVAADGTISLLSNAGSPHAIADVVGFLEHSPTPSLVPLRPVRLLDTRTGNGFAGRLLPTARSLDVLGRGGVPGSGVEAVVVTTTVTGASANGFLTVFPGGAAPLASTLNFTRGQTVANLAVVPLAPDGTISLLANAGQPHAIVDVVGYVARSPLPDVRPLRPSRVLDTRDGTGLSGRLPGRPVDLAVLGRGGVPAAGVRAVLLNVTATGASGSGFLTAYPSGAAAPLASTLNFTRGQTVANLALVPVGPDGRISLYANVGAPHVVADVVGWVG